MMSSNTNIKSQNFKKKSINQNTDTNNVKTQDKFGDLKSKLQKEKQMMRKTGKRFREDTSISTQQISVDTTTDKIQANNTVPLKHEICIGSQQPIKQKISLADLGDVNFTKPNDSMQSSRVFEKQMQQQKKRSKQLHEFLKKLQLQNFTDALIQNGFDDLQTIVDVSTEDLNMVMMRAPQQIKLFQALKSLKINQKEGPSKEEIKKQNSSVLWRMKTQPMQQQKLQISSLKLITKMKTEQKEDEHSGLKPGSFLYSVGSKNWGVEDQIRRACSVCFKVQQQMQKKGTCYYCSNCYKYVSQDLLQIQIGKSMERSYKKLS